MAKLIRILAASLGGGLVLGAGIRLGERLVSQSAGESGEGAGKLAERLGQLEGRLSHLETTGTAQAGAVDLQGIESRIEEQAAAVSAVRVRLDSGASEPETPAKTEERLRAELRAWMDQRVDERLRSVETKLRRESDEAQREMLNAVVESVQTRVILRISKLEDEVAGQAAGMQELRDCTLRTEQSMQKLLGGIDRLIAAQPAREAIPQQPAREDAVVPEIQPERGPWPAAGETQGPNRPQSGEGNAATGPGHADPAGRSRRWSIFG